MKHHYYIITILTSLILISSACKHSPKQADSINNIQKGKNSNYGVAIKDTALETFWKQYSNIIKARDFYRFKKFSQLQVYCCDSLISINEFINKSYDRIFDDRLIKLFSDSSRIEFSSLDTIKKQEPFHKKVQITIDNTLGGISIFEIDFIETSEGLKLYGVDSYGEQHCCS